MGFFLTNQKMKTESKKLTYIFNGIEFIDLNCLKFAVENKAFRKDTYEYLVNSCLKKNHKSNLLPLTTFKEFLRKSLAGAYQILVLLTVTLIKNKRQNYQKTINLS